MSGIDIACLFIAHKHKVRILRRFAMNDGRGSVEFLKKEGQNAFTLEKGLMEWWERELEIRQSDRQNLCFIYDEPYEILSPYFERTAPNSPWENLGLITELLRRCSLEPRELLTPSGETIELNKASEIACLHISVEVDSSAVCVEKSLPKEEENGRRKRGVWKLKQKAKA